MFQANHSDRSAAALRFERARLIGSLFDRVFCTRKGFALLMNWAQKQSLARNAEIEYREITARCSNMGKADHGLCRSCTFQRQIAKRAYNNASAAARDLRAYVSDLWARIVYIGVELEDLTTSSITIVEAIVVEVYDDGHCELLSASIIGDRQSCPFLAS